MSCQNREESKDFERVRNPDLQNRGLSNGQRTGKTDRYDNSVYVIFKGLEPGTEFANRRKCPGRDAGADIRPLGKASISS